MKKQTLSIHARFPEADAYGSLAMPVYHTAAYEFETSDDMEDAFTGRVAMPDYSRVMNPTVTFFENKVKTLTGARSVTAFNSGMAAISSTFIALCSQGQNVVTSRHMFGNTFSFLTRTMRRWGVEARLVDLLDLEEVEAAIDGNTACIFLEVITNPQMEVADLMALAQIAHRHNVPLVADTTVIPFTRFSSHDLGVDIELVSSTKYLSGGATSLGGLIIDYGTRHDVFTKRVKNEILFNLGSYMTPHAAYMQSLGLETLDARYRVQSANTMDLAQRLIGLSAIRRVNYVGLPDNPFHELARRQFNDTYGAMLTIDLEDSEAAKRFINNLRLVRRATNLFDNKTLAIQPSTTIYGNFTLEQRASMDVCESTVRLSVGLESVDDVFEDIRQALL